MTRRIAALLCALALALSLCGCWAEDMGEEEDFWESDSILTEPPEETATPITAFTLPYQQDAGLDPITCPDGMQQLLASLLCEGLFVLDETFTPQEVLCSGYEVNDEHTRYTFYLREGVQFSDGSALSASDVLATLRRAAQSVRYGARFTNVASMRVSNGALVVTLTKPSSAFPALLDIPIVKSGSEKSAVPVGTGPYLFVTDGDGAFLKRSDEWWQDKALPLARIELCPVKDADSASYLFSSREVHLLSADLTGGSELLSAETHITDYASASMIYLGFNTQKTLLSGSELRAAISGALDRATIADGYLAGHAVASRFPLSPRSALYPAALEETLTAPDLAAAIEQAGITEERPRTLTLLVCAGDSFKVSIADYLARTLSTGALTVTVQALPWADYLDALTRGIWDLYLGEVRLTADWDISALVCSDGALNYGGFFDEALESALDTFLADETAATAQTLYRQLSQSAPFTPIAFKQTSVLTPEGLVAGLTPTASTPFYGFEHWQFTFDTAADTSG